MTEASRTEVFNVDINKLYKTIIDYKSYTKFVDGMKDVEILAQDEKSAKVKYTLSMIKEFVYILNLKQESPTKVSWTLDSGDLFKHNNGGWILKDLGNGKTEATYTIDVDFKISVFGMSMIINKLTNSSLPSMMKTFADRASKL